MNRKIILLGYMGCGKSVIGKKLASQIGFPFIDLDDYIEQKERQKISEIFKEKGEIYFRKKELLYLSELLNSSFPMVLSLGGGTPCYGNAMDLINKSTKNVFFIQVSFQELTKRLIPQKHKRPLIAQLQDADIEDFVRKHLFDRNPFYFQAHQTVKATDLSIQEIVNFIVSKMII